MTEDEPTTHDDVEVAEAQLNNPPAEPAVEAPPEEPDAETEAAIQASLVSLGFVGFDGAGASNTTTGAMVPPERRASFRRDIYVGVNDEEQGLEFLGRVVEGPFHTPHEIQADSAISRTTVLYPDRTQFRPTYYVSGSIEILGEIRAGERLVPTPRRPRPYSRIDVFPSDRLREMLGLSGNFLLGKLMGYDDVIVNADGESKGFLPRNVGIFGTVGSGKSNTTQVLIEEALAAGWAVVAVDVEGEYVQMSDPTDDVGLAAVLDTEYGLQPEGVRDLRVYVPSSGTSDAAQPIPFKVPISAVAPEVLADILELSEPQVRMLGTGMATLSRRPPGAQAAARLGALGGAAGTQQPQRPFTLQNLIDGLDEDANGNIPLLPNVRGAERSTAGALRSKLIHLGRSGMLDWSDTARVNELPVDDLLVAGRLSVLDVSETDDRSRNIGISFLLQALFDRVLAVDRGEPIPGTEHARPPVLLVVEEVHTFVSRATASRMRAVLDQLQVISRRGRKRWMGLALVSQQPGHVPDELFELANTRFIHQLKSSSNLNPVRHTTGGVHEALWGTVPALGPGQCLLTGAIFRNPLFVAMRPARSRRLLVA